MYDILIKNVRLFPEENVTRDIGISDGLFTKISEDIGFSAKRVVDGDGNLAIPGFVDVHTHLEKALLMDKVPNHSGTLGEAIANMKAYLRSVEEDDFISRGAAALELAIRHGTSYIRSHISIDPEIELTAFNAMIKLKDRFKNQITLDIVAFPTPHDEVLSRAYLDLLEEALESGATALGGCPTLSPDYRTFIDVMFEMAQRHGCPVDFHVDESDEPDIRTLEYLAEKTIKDGYQGRVVAGHCTSLSVVDDETAARIIRKVKKADISVITLTSANLFLMGRNTSHPRRRGTTRVDDLLSAGVNVAYASDNLRDPFRPFGNFNLLEEAVLTAQVAQLGKDADFPALLSMGTYGAAIAFGLDNYGFYEGNPGTVTVLNAKSSKEAIVAQAQKQLIIKAGQIIWPEF